VRELIDRIMANAERLIRGRLIGLLVPARESHAL